MSTSEHGIPGFGRLGQSPEEAERERIENLERIETLKLRGLVPLSEKAPAVVMRDRSVTVAEQQRQLEVTEALKPMVAAAFGDLKGFLEGLRYDIVAQSELLASINVPLEAVTDSHERASASFETLRADMARMGVPDTSAIQELAKVVDTAGLGKAASRAEKRLDALVAKIEMRLHAIEVEQKKAAKEITGEMVKVLHLLERIYARELVDARILQLKAEKATKAK